MFSNHGHQNPTRQRAEQTARELYDRRRAATEPPKHIRDAWERHASEPVFDLYWQDPGCPQWKYNIGWTVPAVGPDLRHAATDDYPGVVYNVRLAK